MSDRFASARRDGDGLILFVTGDAPRSRRARANLARALRALELEHRRPREIDLIEQPEQASHRGIFAAPALLKTSPDGREEVLYGDLSESEPLQRFLSDLARD